MPERTPFKLDRNDSTKTHAVPRCLELFVNRQDIGVSHSRTINAILALIRPGREGLKPQKFHIDTKHGHIHIYIEGDTVHFPRPIMLGIQPSVFRGVFKRNGMLSPVKSGTVKLPNGS